MRQNLLLPFGRICLLLAVLLLPLVAVGGVWTPDNLPMVYLQDSTRYVCNPDGILEQAVVDSTDAVLRDLEDLTGVQTVVVVVEHVDGDDPYQFGLTLGNKYGVGQKGKDNGLIFVLATLDRSFYMLTGKGLEGVLPDAMCKRIENRITVPLLRQNQWGLAVFTTMKAAAQCIYGDETLLREAEQRAGNSREDDSAADIVGLLFALGVIGAAGYGAYAVNHRRCPHCKAKHTLSVVSSGRIRENGVLKERQNWHCSACGYSETTIHRLPKTTGLGGYYGGGGIGRGGFGGGFGGGSFGGGSFGGGGAGGRF